MNNQIRRLTLVMMGMFLALMIASTTIQFFMAPRHMADSRNQRAIYAAASVDRGPILVDGNAIAYSEPSQDSYKYQRKYVDDPSYALITGYQMVSISAPSTGLEGNQNEVLSGTAPALLGSRLKALFTGSNPRGGALELTIDPDLQRAAWDALGERRGAAVVQDARTGAILAVVSKPSFDPSIYASHDSAEVLEYDKTMLADAQRPLDNRAFGTHLYAPGSVFKLITTATLLENTEINPDTVIEAPTEITLPQSTSTLQNFGGHTCGSGKVKFREAFARSCNTPFAQAGIDLGGKRLEETARDFGFGKKLNIPLAVTPSQFPTVKSKAEAALTSIGQFSLQVSPLQISMITQAVANEGVQMQPYLIKQVLDGELKVSQTTTPSKLATPMTPRVAADISTMMQDAVNQPFGTAAGQGLDKYRAAGKTGTAEANDSNNAWFTGFAPADNPEIVVTVVLEGDASWNQYPTGSGAAVPVAEQIFAARWSM